MHYIILPPLSPRHLAMEEHVKKRMLVVKVGLEVDSPLSYLELAFGIWDRS